MSATLLTPCAEGVSAETLSALRDDLLAPQVATALREHLTTCAACQRAVAEFDSVAWLLRRQPELDPGKRVRAGTHGAIARRGRHPFAIPFRRPLVGVGAALSVVALIALLVAIIPRLSSGHGATAAVTPSATPTGTVLVPNDIGQLYGNVKGDISRLGFTLHFVTIPSPDDQGGKVIAMSPPPGTRVATGASLTITLGGGTGYTLVPNVIGLDASAACQQITFAELSCVVNPQQVQDANVPAGAVASQSPAAGIGQPKGSAVSLTISGGANPPGALNPATAIAALNPTVADGITVAFVINDALYVSARGGAPQMVAQTTLGAAPSVTWSLLWSDDQARLLATVQSVTAPQTQRQGWIITLPGGAATALAPQSPLFDCPCLWLGNRYVLYTDPSTQTPHTASYLIFDTMTNQTISTPIDRLNQPYLPTERAGQLYLVAVGSATDPCALGHVLRYDVATNTLVSFVSLVGYPFTLGMPFGGIAVTGDGQGVVEVTAPDDGGNCPKPPHYAPYSLARPGATPVALFPSLAQNGVDGQPFTIAADGRHVALIGFNSQSQMLVNQEAIATGAVTTNLATTGDANQPINLSNLAWDNASDGVIALHAVTTADNTTTLTTLYYAPAGSDAALAPVMTITASFVAVAVP